MKLAILIITKASLLITKKLASLVVKSDIHHSCRDEIEIDLTTTTTTSTSTTTIIITTTVVITTTEEVTTTQQITTTLPPCPCLEDLIDGVGIDVCDQDMVALLTKILEQLIAAAGECEEKNAITTTQAPENC